MGQVLGFVASSQLRQAVRLVGELEEQRLFRALRRRSLSIHRLAIFLRDTGVHLPEALSLLWTEFSGSSVVLPSSGLATGRTLPLTSAALLALSFCERTMSGPFSTLTQQAVAVAWAGAKADIGLYGETDLSTSSLRDTCAARLACAGMDIRIIKLWMGHRSIRETMHYAQFAERDLDGIVQILEPRLSS